MLEAKARGGSCLEGRIYLPTPRGPNEADAHAACVMSPTETPPAVHIRNQGEKRIFSCLGPLTAKLTAATFGRQLGAYADTSVVFNIETPPRRARKNNKLLVQHNKLRHLRNAFLLYVPLYYCL